MALPSATTVLVTIVASVLGMYLATVPNPIASRLPNGAWLIDARYRVVVGVPSTIDPGDQWTLFTATRPVYLPGGGWTMGDTLGGGVLYAVGDVLIATWTGLGALFVGQQPPTQAQVDTTGRVLVVTGTPSAPAVVNNWVSNTSLRVPVLETDAVRMQSVRHILDKTLTGVQFASDGDNTNSFVWLDGTGTIVMGLPSLEEIRGNLAQGVIVGPGANVISTSAVHIEANCIQVNEVETVDPRLCAQLINVPGATLYNGRGGQFSKEACMVPGVCYAMQDYSWLSTFITPGLEQMYFQATTATCGEFGSTTTIAVSNTPTCDGLQDVVVSLRIQDAWLLKCYSPREGGTLPLDAIRITSV